MTDDRWRRLGVLMKKRRIEIAGANRAAWARKLGLSHDRTLSDIEKGRRKNYSDSTLRELERYYLLADGAIDSFLAGRADRLTERAAETRRPPTASATFLDSVLQTRVIVGAALDDAVERAKRGDRLGGWVSINGASAFLRDEASRLRRELEVDRLLQDEQEQSHAQDKAPKTHAPGSGAMRSKPAPGVTPLFEGDPEPPTQEEVDRGEVAADMDREGDRPPDEDGA